ncbi:malonate transporter [Sporomusaceae bacterium FL31]|nr:malonate transporter [Sporomusaceae bacterium FL31]GCE34438.1 malonate transporter [Sporomusaceae bacterium]
MEHLNTQFLLSLMIIITGYVCKKLSIIKAQDGEGLARIIFNITLPALIITTFSTIKIDFSLIMITVISAFYGLLMAAVGFIVFRKEQRNSRGMLIMLLPGFNIGLFAYPLVEAIWGQAGLQYFGMFDVGNSLVIFIVCYLIASYYSTDSSQLSVKTVFVQLGKSIPLLAYTIAFIAAVGGLKFPQQLLAVTQILAKANMPLSLLLLGIHLSFSLNSEYWRNMGRILAVRYVIGLIVGGLLFWFTPFSDIIRYTLLVGFILPVAMAAIPFAIEFGYDQNFVGTLANMTILISFLLVWIIVGSLY